jgi:hypothetical protein
MATRYYRMSSLRMAEAVVRRLATENGFVLSRPLGYAHRRLVRIDFARGRCPDELVREIDAIARPVPEPADWIALSGR